MGKQVKVFELLSKKQSLNVFKNQKKKNQLVDELKAATAYQKKLTEILTNMSKELENKTVSQIKAENWYNLKIQDELIATVNKIEFLTIEIKNQGVQIALASEKKRKFDEKKIQIQKINAQELENKIENMAAAPSKNGPKY